MNYKDPSPDWAHYLTENGIRINENWNAFLKQSDAADYFRQHIAPKAGVSYGVQCDNPKSSLILAEASTSIYKFAAEVLSLITSGGHSSDLTLRKIAECAENSGLVTIKHDEVNLSDAGKVVIDICKRQQ